MPVCQRCPIPLRRVLLVAVCQPTFSLLVAVCRLVLDQLCVSSRSRLTFVLWICIPSPSHATKTSVSGVVTSISPPVVPVKSWSVVSFTTLVDRMGMAILNSRMLTSTKTIHLGYPVSLPLCLLRHWICSPRLARPRCNGQLIPELKVLMKLTTVTVKISQDSRVSFSVKSEQHVHDESGRHFVPGTPRARTQMQIADPILDDPKIARRYESDRRPSISVHGPSHPGPAGPPSFPQPVPGDAQLSLLTQLVSQMAQAQLTQTQVRKIPKVPLAKLGPNDDAEAFLTSFERSMAAYRVRCED